MKTIIEFENISKSFGKVCALSGVSFSINKAEVHSIVGENGAGKSTLMNILAGLFLPTTGKIVFDGSDVELINEQVAIQLGIGIVYQELKLCPNLSITENIFLGRELRTPKRRLDWKRMHEESSAVMHSLGADIPSETLVKNLSIAQQQLVEIAKSLSRDIKVIVLDEPTSALTITESIKLFENIQRLKEKGVTIIYISHRLEEVLDMSDRISVLRDGTYCGTFAKQDVGIESLVKLIAGEKLSKEFGMTEKTSKPPKPSGLGYLQVKNISSADGRVKNVSFELFEGEVLGIYGVQGAGRTEMLECLFGMRKMKDGVICLDGKVINNTEPIIAINNGFAMIPEDRKRSGLFPNMSIMENINTSNVEDITHAGVWMHKKSMRKVSERYRKEVSIKTHDIHQNIMNLSGGNQQKVVISRWLATEPRVLLMDELTRGVDVGAKAEIFEILRTLRSKGIGIVLVSSELHEVIAEASRVLIMKNGEIVKELIGNEINKDEIVRHALIGESSDA